MFYFLFLTGDLNS